MSVLYDIGVTCAIGMHAMRVGSSTNDSKVTIVRLLDIDASKRTLSYHIFTAAITGGPWSSNVATQRHMHGCLLA